MRNLSHFWQFPLFVPLHRLIPQSLTSAVRFLLNAESGVKL
ncbi:hypothetical protein Csa_023582 [Cucumis sativus]|nr:hypothetical protein Csa_023582 [Cucumis sativus]